MCLSIHISRLTSIFAKDTVFGQEVVMDDFRGRRQYHQLDSCVRSGVGYGEYIASSKIPWMRVEESPPPRSNEGKSEPQSLLGVFRSGAIASPL